MMLLIGVKVIRIGGNENTRVISIVEQFEDDTLWEFHSKSVRRAQVSKKTWDEYVKYKEQTCRLEVEKDAESKARGYLNWEEMAFHKSLRLKLLPGLTTNDALSYEDAIMLSNVDSRLLSPEPESLCKIGIIDDSDQIEIAEKSRFEDTLISRIFAVPIFDDDYDY
ncbi:GMP synthase [Dirofilaria immitis]